jgi:hypothetical protein
MLRDHANPAVSGRDTSDARQPLRVGKDQKYHTVRDALNSAVPGDHIVVQGPEHEEELSFDGKKKNLTIESENPAEPVVWRLPKATKEAAHVINLNGVDGLRLRNFKFDSERCTKSVVLLYGHCPGTVLEDVTVRGFTDCAVLLMNCDGDEARPVTLTRLTVVPPAGKTADAAVAFGLNKDVEPKANRCIHFNDLRIEGEYKTARVRSPEKIGDDVTGLPK